MYNRSSCCYFAGRTTNIPHHTHSTTSYDAIWWFCHNKAILRVTFVKPRTQAFQKCHRMVFAPVLQGPQSPVDEESMRTICIGYQYMVTKYTVDVKNTIYI